jgi:hypothetical protein
MDLKPGMRVLRARGPPVTVVSVERTGVVEATFNLEVADWHTYFVGDAGVWVHNSNCGFGVNDPPVRVPGKWSDDDLRSGLQGKPPVGLGSPDLHHADQMPGSGIHELLPSQHRGSGLHGQPNQGVTDKMRKEDRQLHWWYRAREQGAEDKFPDDIYDNR